MSHPAVCVSGSSIQKKSRNLEKYTFEKLKVEKKEKYMVSIYSQKKNNIFCLVSVLAQGQK